MIYIHTSETIILRNRCRTLRTQLEKRLQGLHMSSLAVCEGKLRRTAYKAIWAAAVGEELVCDSGPNNDRDRYSVPVTTNHLLQKEPLSLSLHHLLKQYPQAVYQLTMNHL